MKVVRDLGVILKEEFKLEVTSILDFNLEVPELATCSWIKIFDAPPTSLMDSIVSPKVKAMEGKGVGVCSFVRNPLGVKGRAGALGWDHED